LPPHEAKLVRLILTNAIYFKGAWSVPFSEADTKPRDFTLADGKKIKAPIMNARWLDVGCYGAFNADGSLFKTPVKIKRGQKTGLYPGAKGFAMLELPYKGDDISMVLIAPNAHDGLGVIEKKLTTDNLAAWIGKLQKRKTNVFLPKFKLETKYEMNDTLKAMGMARAFTDPRSPKGADFTGMCASKDPRHRLYITKVIHKAFVEVNEKGTEAAAATAVIMSGVRSAPMSRPFTPTFQADRPFLFVIRDKQTNSILFMGRINNPLGK
jgi:serine protease inhibitor